MICNINSKTNAPNGLTYKFVLDAAHTRESVEQTMAGLSQSLARYAIIYVYGASFDSGAGTPEANQIEYKQQGILAPEGMDGSCGLHDVQSVVHLAMKHYISEGIREMQHNTVVLYRVLNV